MRLAREDIIRCYFDGFDGGCGESDIFGKKKGDVQTRQPHCVFVMK